MPYIGAHLVIVVLLPGADLLHLAGAQVLFDLQVNIRQAFRLGEDALPCGLHRAVLGTCDTPPTRQSRKNKCINCMLGAYVCVFVSNVAAKIARK